MVDLYTDKHWVMCWEWKDGFDGNDQRTEAETPQKSKWKEAAERPVLLQFHCIDSKWDSVVCDTDPRQIRTEEGKRVSSACKTIPVVGLDSLLPLLLISSSWHWFTVCYLTPEITVPATDYEVFLYFFSLHVLVVGIIWIKDHWQRKARDNALCKCWLDREAVVCCP